MSQMDWTLRQVSVFRQVGVLRRFNALLGVQTLLSQIFVKFHLSLLTRRLVLKHLLRWRCHHEADSFFAQFHLLIAHMKAGNLSWRLSNLLHLAKFQACELLNFLWTKSKALKTSHHLLNIPPLNHQQIKWCSSSLISREKRCKWCLPQWAQFC